MQNQRRFLASAGLVAALVLGWAVGCGSSDSSGQATLGPAGGTLSIPGSGVELVVPAGALSQPVDVSMKASRDATALTVSLQPVDLALAHAATLSVTLSGRVHFSGVTELGSGRPLGLDARIEGPSSAVARLRMDRFRHVRFATELVDGGGAPGACREHEDGEDHEGEHDGDEDGDGGHHDRDAGPPMPVPDGGVPSMACPAGFECDDGVCVAPGGNDEHHGECDGGSCDDDDEHHGGCDGGSCHDDDDDDRPDAGHR